MTTRYANTPKAVNSYSTSDLREEFLFTDVMEEDKINLTYSHYDRFVFGGVVPLTSILLENYDQLKSEFFLERREMGVINVGGKGEVHVDGEIYVLDEKDALYIGKGKKEIIFSSHNAEEPAKFYMNSTPAHCAFPTKHVSLKDSNKLELGSLETSNHRVVYQMIIAGIVDTCQLQMGLTVLKTGSVWNTMPAHVHERRMEVYFYTDVQDEQSVCHFMGQPGETRHVWLNNNQAIVSPPWSIHSGAGTSNYSFVWGMAGENLDYSDMEICRIVDLR